MAEDKTSKQQEERYSVQNEEGSRDSEKKERAKENNNKNNKNNIPRVNSNDIGEMDYILFLILVLLLAGSKQIFTPYIELFQQQAGSIKQTLDAFSFTAEELEKVMTASEKLR
ncbi:MAG: hypothetical protein ACOCV3_04320 [Halanaerobiales bacterium]